MSNSGLITKISGVSKAQLQRVAGLLLVVAVWVVYFVWWTPRRLERALRPQGLDGTPYRFPHGDREQSARLDREVHAKPMPFSHSIIPRVAPFTHRTVSQYGKISFTWAGSVPEVTITDVGLFFFKGDFTYESEKWVKHRRILNPAFHMEKLKQMGEYGGFGDRLRVSCLAGDVIARAAFGTSYEEGRRIYQLQAQQAVLFVQPARYLRIPGDK
nr:PREDICTED: cytochrome P450 72A15-like [Musa acuminata subsp. malaccensis]